MKLTKEFEMEPVDVEEQFDNEILETKTPKTIHDLLTTVVTSKKTLKKAISVSTLLAVVCFVGVAVAGSATCGECTIGRYQDTTTNACVDCETGKYSEWSKQTSCVHCPPGKYQDAEGYTLCHVCSGRAPVSLPVLGPTN